VNGCWQSRRIGGSNSFTAVVILQFGRRKEKFQGDRNRVRVPVEPKNFECTVSWSYRSLTKGKILVGAQLRLV